MVESQDPARSLRAIALLLERVGRHLERSEEELRRARPEISGWSPAEHLFHAVLALDLSFRNASALACDRGALLREPEDRKEEALAMLRRGRFPRGVAQAPRFVTPPETVELGLVREIREELATAVEMLEGNLEGIREAPRVIPHQLLGDLTCAEWLRFARAHTTHHLLIVRELLRAA